MQISIRRENEEFGPYSREMVVEYVRQGAFKLRDQACYAGAGEWKTIGELLGIASVADLRDSGKITEFNPSLPPARSTLPPPRQDLVPQSFMAALSLLLILIVAAVVYIRVTGSADRLLHYIAATSAPLPTPAPKPAGTPAPVKSTPQPTPLPTPAPQPSQPPVAAGTPTPIPGQPPPSPPPPAAPKPFDPADLAANPASWPKTVRLKQAVVFPALLDSRIVGTVTAPAGAAVNLVKIQGGQLLLDFQGGTQSVSWRLTDLQEQVARQPAASPSPPGG